jgi:hypothetical protein
LFPKFVAGNAATYDELRERGTGVVEGWLDPPRKLDMTSKYMIPVVLFGWCGLLSLLEALEKLQIHAIELPG